MIAVGLKHSPMRIDMTKGKSGAFRGFQGKGTAPAGGPQPPKRPAPPPRVTVRPKASSKGR
jgi:hypothetical protein